MPDEVKLLPCMGVRRGKRDGKCLRHARQKCASCLSEWGNSKDNIARWFPQTEEPY